MQKRLARNLRDTLGGHLFGSSKRTDITSLQETFEGSATQVAHTELDAWGHCSFLRIACPGQGVRMGEMAE